VFDVIVRIGTPEMVPASDEMRHAHCRSRLSLDPLARNRWIAGQNAFQVLCLALDYVRTVFKVFVAEGGRVYWGDDMDSSVDLDSPWFEPRPSFTQIGLKLSGE
jgi:hypothetical protein